MSEQLQLRRGTAAAIAASTGAQGELFYSTDSKRIAVQDGVTPGGAILALLSDVVAASGSPYLPTGSVAMYMGTTDPTGWLIMDGRAISRTTYPTLNAIASAASYANGWGPGDGSTTFNIPNPHARFPVAAGAAGGLTTKALGATGGAETVALSIAQLPSHNHTDLSHTHPAVSNGHAHSYSQPVSGGGVQFGIGGVGLGTVAGATAIGYDSITIDPGYANISYTGSGSPVATMPPWFAFNFIIKT